MCCELMKNERMGFVVVRWPCTGSRVIMFNNLSSFLKNVENCQKYGTFKSYTCEDTG